MAKYVNASRPRRPDTAAYRKPATCCWPECATEAWTESQLPVCPHHAAKIHLRVVDMTPIESQRSGRADRQELWYAREGWVYIARVGDLYKIGFSTDVPQRMTALGAVLVAAREGTLGDERDLHAMFRDTCEHGEYFRQSAELDALIGRWLDGARTVVQNH